MHRVGKFIGCCLIAVSLLACTACSVSIGQSKKPNCTMVTIAAKWILIQSEKLKPQSVTNYRHHLPDDGKRKKAVVEQRYLHVPFLNYGGFDFQSRRFLFAYRKVYDDPNTVKIRRLMAAICWKNDRKKFLLCGCPILGAVLGRQ